MNNITSEKKFKVCSIDGCNEKHVSRGYCKSHYYRYKRYGDPLVVRQVQSKYTDGSCKMKKCEQIHYAKGYCKFHHHRWDTYGDPLYERPTTCKMSDCDNPIEAWGLCQKHYRRLRVHGDPLKVEIKYNAPCKIEGCKNKNRRNGYCEKHYLQSDLYRNRHRMYSAKRRSLKLNAPINDFIPEQWKEIQSHFDNECAYCGSDAKMEQEHVMPLSKGGSHTAGNIITACASCNSSKRQSLIEKWYPQQPFYDREREEKILKWMGYKVHENKLQMQLF